MPGGSGSGDRNRRGDTRRRVVAKQRRLRGTLLGVVVCPPAPRNRRLSRSPRNRRLSRSPRIVVGSSSVPLTSESSSVPLVRRDRRVRPGIVVGSSSVPLDRRLSAPDAGRTDAGTLAGESTLNGADCAEPSSSESSSVRPESPRNRRLSHRPRGIAPAPRNRRLSHWIVVCRRWIVVCPTGSSSVPPDRRLSHAGSSSVPPDRRLSRRELRLSASGTRLGHWNRRPRQSPEGRS